MTKSELHPDRRSAGAVADEFEDEVVVADTGRTP